MSEPEYLLENLREMAASGVIPESLLEWYQAALQQPNGNGNGPAVESNEPKREGIDHE